MDGAERGFRRSMALEAGQLHIGASDTLCRYYLLSKLETFHEQHPAVTLHVTNRTTFETLEFLRGGQADLGFVNLPIDGAEFDVRPCFTIHDCLVGGARYAHLAEKGLRLDSCRIIRCWRWSG